MTTPRERSLGNTGLEVTELGLGAASLGNLARPLDDEQARAIVHAGLRGGLRYIDTAPHYGLGLSEKRLSCLLPQAPEGLVLSTKVGRLLEPNPSPAGSDLAVGGFAVPDDLIRRFDFSRDGVRRSLESSLDRLGVDRVDIAYLHDPDGHGEEATREGLPALAALRDEGVIGAVGVAMNQWQLPLRMVQEAELDVVMLAGRWTLLDRSGEPLLDACAEEGVAVIVAAPYNSGLLATDVPPADTTFDYRPVPPGLLRRTRAMAEICAGHGVRLPEAALQFPLRHPAVVSVVAGPRTPHEVAEQFDRLAAPIPDALWAALN